MSQIPPARAIDGRGVVGTALAALLLVAALLLPASPPWPAPPPTSRAEFSPVDTTERALRYSTSPSAAGAYKRLVPGCRDTALAFHRHDGGLGLYLRLPYRGEVSRLTLTIDGPKIARTAQRSYLLAVDLLSSPSGPVSDSATFTSPALRADQSKNRRTRTSRAWRWRPGDQLATPTLNAP